MQSAFKAYVCVYVCVRACVCPFLDVDENEKKIWS